jgi:hypothetical protein
MSASLIVRNKMESDSHSLKSTLSDLFDKKTKEFVTQMKSEMKAEMDSFMEQKIEDYYGHPLEEDSLFDTILYGDSVEVLENYYRQKKNQPMLDLIEESKSQKCFHFKAQTTIDNKTFNTYNYYFFKHCLIRGIHEDGKEDNYSITAHKLPLSVLLTIKWFQLSPDRSSITTQLAFYEENPLYFKPNCIEFEQMCAFEHTIIKNKHAQVDALIQDYAAIEAENKHLKSKEKEVEEERQKLEEEKKQLLRMKQKLSLLKASLDKERFDLDKEKAALDVMDFNSMV